MITVQVDDFPGGGTLATLSPGLALVIDLGHTHPHVAHNVGVICRKCRAPIQSFKFWHRKNEPERPEVVLRCRCVALVFGPSIEVVDLLDNWEGFIRLKGSIMTELVRIQEPQRN
jgi:hypothetical protein